MQIKCTGGTKNQKKYAKSIALFCAGKLMHRNLIENIGTYHYKLRLVYPLKIIFVPELSI